MGQTACATPFLLHEADQRETSLQGPRFYDELDGSRLVLAAPPCSMRESHTPCSRCLTYHIFLFFVCTTANSEDMCVRVSTDSATYTSTARMHRAAPIHTSLIARPPSLISQIRQGRSGQIWIFFSRWERSGRNLIRFELRFGVSTLGVAVTRAAGGPFWW